MSPTVTMKRRCVLRQLLLAFPAGLAPWKAAAAPAVELRYRADACISLLSIPLYSRAGVGSGYARLETRMDGSRQAHRLAFAAGSWPERAAGFNRLGYIREEVIEQDAHAVQASYLGCMTSSPEQTLEEARASMGNSEAEIMFTAIRGSLRPGHWEAATAKFPAAKRISWSNAEELWPMVEQAFTGRLRATVKQESRAAEEAARECAPFLRTVLCAMWHPEEQCEKVFAYGVREYSLKVKKSPDPGMGAKLAKRGVVNEPARVMLMKGEIRNLRSGAKDGFRLWFEASGTPALPVRIELKPRSYLALVFEADPTLPPFQFSL